MNRLVSIIIFSTLCLFIGCKFDDNQDCKVVLHLKGDYVIEIAHVKSVVLDSVYFPPDCQDCEGDQVYNISILDSSGLEFGSIVLHYKFPSIYLDKPPTEIDLKSQKLLVTDSIYNSRFADSQDKIVDASYVLEPNIIFKTVALNGNIELHYYLGSKRFIIELKNIKDLELLEQISNSIKIKAI